MDPHDDDIEISFFDDEPATTEAATSRVRLPRRGGQGTGGGRPRRPQRPPRPVAPVLRLLAAVVGAIVILVVFGLLIQSCASTSKHDAYAHYMTQVGQVAHASAQDGQQVASALTTPNAKVSTLAAKLDGIAAQEQQNVVAARRLDPPGRLRTQNTQLVDALLLRVNGTQKLAEAFRATASSKSSNDGSLLLEQANRLLASDVVYDDLFRGPSNAVMKQQGVVGVAVPESHYVASPDELTLAYWTGTLQRLRGGGTGASSGSSNPNAIHGTNLASTRVEPGGQTLSAAPGALNTVVASTNLAFLVDVHDGGTAQEVQIGVTLTIQKPQGAIVKTQTIPVINPGKDVTLRFPIAESVPFAVKTSVKVDVATVPHEKDAANNTATYPVIFSLGG